MDRRAIGLFLGVSMLFAALPAFAVFSFGSGSTSAEAELTRVPVTIVAPAGDSHPLAFGAASHSACDELSGDADSTLF